MSTLPEDALFTTQMNADTEVSSIRSREGSSGQVDNPASVLTPVTSREDIAAAFEAIDNQLRQSARTYRRTISRQCGVG